MKALSSNSTRHKNRDAKILVVDDDSELRMLVKVILKAEGFTGIEDLSNGEAAVKRLQTTKQSTSVDLVLLDWQMPGLPGIDVLKTIRAWKIAVPVIMLTAQCSEERVKEAIAEGVSDYLIKPFSQLSLMNKIDRILSESRTPTP